MGSLAFVSNLRIEEYWSVEALECNGKICLMFVEVPRGSSSEASLGDGVATVNDLVIELGDSSSIALCLKITTTTFFSVFQIRQVLLQFSQCIFHSSA